MRLFLLAFLLSMFTAVLAAPAPYTLAREAASASAEVDWVLPQKAVDRRPLAFTPPPIVLTGESDSATKTASKSKGKGKLARKNGRVLNDRIARSLAKNRELIMRKALETPEDDDIEERMF